MARSKGTELSVFKGREARLNHAIFQTIAERGALTIYEAHKQIRSPRGLRHTKYTNVSRSIDRSKPNQPVFMKLLYAKENRKFEIHMELEWMPPDTESAKET